MDLLANGLLYALIPMFCFIIGNGIILIRNPSIDVYGSLQYFAAVVFGLLPVIETYHHPMHTVIGIIAGIIAMLAVKIFVDKIETRGSKSKLPIPFLSAVGINLFIDELLISITITASQAHGLYITAALSIQILILGLSTYVTLTPREDFSTKTFISNHYHFSFLHCPRHFDWQYDNHCGTTNKLYSRGSFVI